MEHFFYDKHQLGMWELQHDILYDKIPPNRYYQLIDFAWNVGRETAREYGEKYQTSVPSQLAAELKLSVLEIEEGLVLPEYQIYSEYFSNLKRIVLHKNTIAEEVKRSKGKGRVHCENYEQIRELFIAHEVYHHIECHHQGVTSQKQKIVSFKIGPLQLTSGVRALCEIGAHSFTKALLQIEEEGLYGSV
jgi:hypothetical protein